MTDITREALGVLAELCELSPDVRLGQLLAHLGFLGEDQSGKPLWTIDDDQLLDVLYHHRAELLARTQDTLNVPGIMSLYPIPEDDRAPDAPSPGS